MVNGRNVYEYLVSSAEKGAKGAERLVTDGLDFAIAVKNGVILGYYDAKGQYHRITKEDDPKKIIKNFIGITLLMPGGVVAGPAYLIHRGRAYLIKRKIDKVKRTEEREGRKDSGLEN